jgi:hypothetical protein
MAAMGFWRDLEIRLFFLFTPLQAVRRYGIMLPFSRNKGLQRRKGFRHPCGGASGGIEMATDTSKIVTIESLKADIARYQKSLDERNERINRWETDEDDCFISIKVETDGIKAAEMKIKIIENGGTQWFDWYTDLNGVVCEDARWVQTKYGYSLVVNFADGRTIWTTATTEKGLARKGLKKISARFPVWVKSFCNGSGLCGVYCSTVGTYRAELNRATGEYHPEPYEIGPALDREDD